MNDDKPIDALPAPLSPPAHVPTPVETGNILAALLKAPELVARAIAEDKNCLRSGVFLLVSAALFHAGFGLAAGLFGGWPVGVMAAVKAPLIGVCSLLLCFPSLYVFSAVGGAPLSIRQTFMFGSSCLAMLGLLLIALAPVAWLFSVSTESLAFIVRLVLFIWVICVLFALRYTHKMKANIAFRRSGGIGFWFLVFVLVSLQMATSMRPLLTRPSPGQGWWTPEKKFFLAQFASCFEKQISPPSRSAAAERK